jgi:competence protein ComEC
MSVTIACVDVGQGDCTVAVDHGSADALLIDCPSGQHRAALDELGRLGAQRLAAAVVTHSQRDHFGGVLDVLEALQERFTGSLFFNNDSLLAAPVAGVDRKIAGMKLRALLLRAREYRGRICRADDSVPGQTVGRLGWRLLAPSYDDLQDAVTSGDPNRASGVLALAIDDDLVLIGGDAPLDTWKRIAGGIARGAVVRWPHHGGGIGGDAIAHASVRDLLEPAVALVSVGASNSHGHPSEAFFSALGGQPGRLLCTQATSKCTVDGGVGRVCAGTIRIESRGDGRPTVRPDTANHAAVVHSLGNARCLPETEAS